MKENNIFKLEKKNLEEVVLRCDKITKMFTLQDTDEKLLTLNQITLSENSEFMPIKRGEFVIIRGPSGGGKTTLLNILGTLDSEFEGELELMGTKINKNCSDDFLSDLRLKKKSDLYFRHLI